MEEPTKADQAKVLARWLELGLVKSDAAYSLTERGRAELNGSSDAEKEAAEIMGSDEAVDDLMTDLALYGPVVIEQ